jgi:hypothetical protein
VKADGKIRENKDLLKRLAESDRHSSWVAERLLNDIEESDE